MPNSERVGGWNFDLSVVKELLGWLWVLAGWAGGGSSNCEGSLNGFPSELKMPWKDNMAVQIALIVVNLHKKKGNKPKKKD